MSDNELSPAGDRIIYHRDVQQKDFVPAEGNIDNINAITEHIERHIGTIEAVFHEIVSDQVHIDVYWVKPSGKLPFHVLITSGMSDLPMQVPENMKQYEYAEVCILLPAQWKIESQSKSMMEDVFKDENNYWPVRWLKTIARFPHEYDTWLGFGHTVPNGPDAAPFSDNTKLGCILLLPSLTLGPLFYELKINEEKTVRFFCLFPLYKEEMELKINEGMDALINKFEKYDIRDVVDINRRNVCVKKKFFGLW